MALRSEGTVLSRGDGETPEVFSPLGTVRSITGMGGGSPTVIDVSHLGSAFREKLLGLRDEGQLTFELQWDGEDETFRAIWADRAAGTLRNWQIELPDDTVFTFSAYVMTAELSAETDAAITVSVTLEISGAATPQWS